LRGHADGRLRRVFTESSRAMRLGRALCLAWLAVTVSSLAHAAAGGEVAGSAQTLAVVGALGVAVAPLTGRAMSLTRSSSLLLGLQVLVHLGHTAAAALTAARVTPTPQLAAALGDHHHGTLRPPSVPAGAAHLHVVDQGLGSWGDLLPSVQMLGAHAAVALLLGWLLASAERSWWVACGVRDGFARLAATLTRGTRLVHAVATLALRAILTSAHGSLGRPDRPARVRRPRDIWRAPSAVRRGPPQLLRA
jgi:hypothetical protein